MNFFIIVSIISTLALSANAQFPDVCSWQKNTASVVQKLTPSGQSAVNTILKDLQFTMGAAIQPVYQNVRTQYPFLIAQLEATDNQNFQTVLAAIGYNNPNCGAGNLVDLCQWQAQGSALFAKFRPENQQAVLTLVKSVATTVGANYQIVYAMVAQKNAALVAQLVQNESPANLAALGQAMGYSA